MSPASISAHVSAIGKYAIVRELGRGATGVVYLATDTNLGRDVALKALLPSLSNDPEFIERFKAEARTVATLSHPNIVGIHSLDIIDGQVVLDMDYVAGTSLGPLVASRALGPAELATVGIEVLGALSACHSVGIVHRDIKPANILIHRDGRARVADFGLAKAYAAFMESSVSKSSHSGLFLGTPRYAPPEAWMQTDFSPAWDIYSVGAVLYEALSGRPPYDGATPFILMKQMFSEEVAPLRELNPAISEALASVVHRLLSRNPADRPSAAAALNELRAVPEYDPTIHHSESVSIRSAVQSAISFAKSLTDIKARRRHRYRVVGLAGAGAVAAIMWLAASFLPGRPAPASSVPDQASLFQERIPGVPALLAARMHGNGNPARLFDSYIHQSNTSSGYNWLWSSSATGDPDIILARQDLGFWFMRAAKPDAKNVIFEGEWAEYLDTAGRGFRRGTLKGAGVWVVPGESLTATLDFECVEDASSWQWTVTLSAGSTEITDTRYLHDFEEQPLLRSLIYNELLPRHLTWAESVDRLFPSIADARIRVPYEAAADNAAGLDGQLSEEWWTHNYFDPEGRLGVLRGFPASAQCVLRMVSTPGALLVGVRANAPDARQVTLELALSPRVVLQESSSSCWLIRVQPDGSVETTQHTGNVDVPVSMDVSAAFHQEDRVLFIELRVPYASLGLPGLPSIEDRWRFNCLLRDAAPGSGNRVIASWGFPELLETAHGAIASFSLPGGASHTSSRPPAP